MKVKLIAVGTKMPQWTVDGFDEYVRRLPVELHLQLIEVALGYRGKNGDIDRAIRQEGEQILGHIKPMDKVIALEIKGKSWSTPHLAEQLKAWQMQGDDIALLIGGPDGLSASCRKRADSLWSLSSLTLPHPLVRVLLAEQLYRAWSITRNHPYHR